MNARTLLIATLALGMASIAGAQTPPSQPNGQGATATPKPHHRRPPPQAIEACDGKKAGDACTFTGREGEQLSGTCFSPPAHESKDASEGQGQGDRPMACRPKR